MMGVSWAQMVVGCGRWKLLKDIFIFAEKLNEV